MFLQETTEATERRRNESKVAGGTVLGRGCGEFIAAGFLTGHSPGGTFAGYASSISKAMSRCPASCFRSIGLQATQSAPAPDFRLWRVTWSEGVIDSCCASASERP